MTSASKTLILSLLFFTLSCAEKVNYVQNLSSNDPGPVEPIPNNNNNGNGNGGTDTSLGNICSKLDFSEVKWPTLLATSNDRKSFALAANITGSYEGHAGWANITNNFDGQGMSLGLNQQNFGQGSLQPLLTKVIKSDSNLVQILFSAANYKSLTQMLSTYQGAAVLKVSAESENLFSNEAALSPLDLNYSAKVSVFNASTDISVAWAKNNLYLSNGTTFKTDWKNSFVTLAVSPAYRSIQIEAALNLYTKAKGYFKAFKFRQLKSLLLMYDFVVQNGGFNTTHLAQMTAYDSKNPSAAETTRLAKLLEIRAATVNPTYKNDVIARKSTIINGTGTVHGTSRNLQKEYCYDGNQNL